MHKFTLSRQTVKMLVIKFAGTFGSGMLNFAIGLYILKRTGSALGMGVSMITGPLVSLVLTPVVGYVVDTKNHRRTMALAQVGTTIGLLVFALVFRLWPAQYYVELIGLIIILQVTDNFLSTTLTSSLVELFSGAELQKVNSLNQSITSIAAFLAPIIGAVVYTLVTLDVFVYIEVCFELAALAGILALHFQKAEAAAAAAPKPESLLENFRGGLKYVLHQRLILLICLSSAAINFFFAALNIGEPYLLVKTLKLPNTFYGITESGFAIGMFAGGVILSAMTLKSHPVQFSYRNLVFLSGMLMLTGLPQALAAGSGFNAVYFTVLNVVNGLLLVFINTPISTFMQQLIPGNIQGRVFSLEATISQLLAPLGTLLFGVLFDHFSALPIFGLTGMVLLLLSVGVIVILAQQKMLEKPENQVAAAQTQE